MTKISDLTALTGAGVDDAADLLPIVDMSEAGAARNKKITIDETRIALGLSSADSPQFTGLNLGHASDTTITRVSAGVVAIEGVNIVTTAGGVTFSADISVPAEAYGVSWNASNEVPTKNDVYDKIEALAGGVTTLDGLTDVNAPTPSNNDVLTWDSTPGEWVAAAPSGGSFTAASTTEILTGTDTTKGGTPDSIAALWEQGSDVASAGTISLGDGGYFNITGTTTITDIDFATDKAGRKAWVKFAGVLTITQNASTLILPTGANITTAAGDTACFISEGTDVVRCVSYNRASGAALSGSGAALGGALVHKAADQTTANYSAGVVVAWDSETNGYDDAAYHDTVTNNSRITIPTTGKYRFDFGIEIASPTLTASDYARAGLIKNGAVAPFPGARWSITEISGTPGIYLNGGSAVISCTAADYFEVWLDTESDTSITVTAAGSWFAVERVE